jgi:hypothetical protein
MLTARGVTAFMVIVCAVYVGLSGCATEPVEAPFETTDAGARMAEADHAFGWYIHQPDGVDRVQVHRMTIPGDWERGFEELPVDVYYPPRFRYRSPEPAVVIIAGGVKWSANISLAAMLAVEGVPAVVVDSIAAGDDIRPALEALRSRAEEVFIDPDHLAIWAEGHESPKALEALLDPRWQHHGALKAGVFVSPYLVLGKSADFTYPRAAMATDVPIFIATARNDGFYEIQTSVEKFTAAAAEYGIPVEHAVSPVGGHNWMVEEQGETEAVGVVRRAVNFVRRKL